MQWALAALPAMWVVGVYAIYFWTWFQVGESPRPDASRLAAEWSGTLWPIEPAAPAIVVGLLHLGLLLLAFWPVYLAAWVAVSDIVRRSTTPSQRMRQVLFWTAALAVAISLRWDPLGAVRWLFE